MRRLFIAFSFLLYFSFLPNLSYAFGLLGGNITYSCTDNPDEYLVELRIYSDADEPSSMSETINYSSAACGVGKPLDLLLQSTTPIPQSCPTIPNVEERLFSGIMSLTVTYTTTDGVEMSCDNCCDDWVISYATCCRSNAITSGGADQDFYLSATLDNRLQPCNSSPVFSSSGLIFICNEGPVSSNQGATDSDGGLLVYSLVNCAQSSGTSVSYNSGLSGLQPLSTTSGFTIDSETGELNFTPTPDVNEVAPICVLVEEFRNGVKIGEVVRDILFVSNKPVTAPVSVPVMGQLGIIMMILLLLTVGIAVLNSIRFKLPN